MTSKREVEEALRGLIDEIKNGEKEATEQFASLDKMTLADIKVAVKDSYFKGAKWAVTMVSEKLGTNKGAMEEVTKDSLQGKLGEFEAMLDRLKLKRTDYNSDIMKEMSKALGVLRVGVVSLRETEE